MLKDRVEVETWQNDWFGSGQSVTGQVYSYFSNNFFFQLQKQINDNLFRENE